jgi:hypothetical protein
MKVIKGTMNYDLQESQFTGTLPDFQFVGNLEFSNDPLYYLTELRIWSCARELDELIQYSRTPMTDYESPLLVGYWKMKPFNDHFYLEDSSLNLQYTPRHPNGPHIFIYDDLNPISCLY